MSASSGEAAAVLTAVFADICGSTKLYERVGDREAIGLISRAFYLLGRLIEEHRGRLIRTQGDEVLCSFDDPVSAIRAVEEMHRSVTGDRKLSRRSVSLRIGLNTGPAIFHEGDIYGDAVNVAARAVGLAERNQIITTAATIDALPRDGRPISRTLGRLSVKGKEEPIEFFEVLWDESPGVTRLETREAARSKRPSRMRLRLEYAGESLEAGPERSLVYLGRGKDNDLVVERHFVSRMHASIEYGNGKFVLSDHSTNGSHMKPEGGEPVFVHRDQVTLFGRGTISLGRGFNKEDAEIIRFAVKG